MGYGRIGVAAGIASFASFIAVELVQAAGWTMPDQLTIGLLAFMLLMGGIAALVVVWEVHRLSVPIVQRYRIQWPLADKNAPDPNQRLLDIAQEDAYNPSRFLLITDTMITDLDFSPDLEMPWIELGAELLNCNVHNVLVGGASGRARFNGKELREAINGSLGKSNMPRGHKQVYKMKQYLSPQQAAQIHAERREETRVCGGQRRKELRSLDLSGVAIEIECEGHVIPFTLGGVQRFRYD